MLYVSVVGSNPWSHLHPVLVMKSMVPFTPFTLSVVGQTHAPIYTLYLSLF